MNGSSAKSKLTNRVTVVGDKITNGPPTATADTIRKYQNQEEIWDQNPKMTCMNSMECWDYTIELECLQGPQGFFLFFILFVFFSKFLSLFFIHNSNKPTEFFMIFQNKFLLNHDFKVSDRNLKN